MHVYNYIRSSEEILGLVKLIEGSRTLDIFLSFNITENR